MIKETTFTFCEIYLLKKNYKGFLLKVDFIWFISG